MFFRQFSTSALLMGLLCVGCSRSEDDYHVVTVDESAPATQPALESTAADKTPATETKDDSAAPPAAMKTADPVSEESSSEQPLAEKSSPAKPASGKPADEKVGADVKAEEASLKANMSSRDKEAVSVASLSSPAMAVPGTPTAEPLPGGIRILVPNKEFTTEGKDKAIRITFDDLDLLKVCNMEPVPPDVMNHLPDWLKDLDGKRIILRGWMFPSGRQDGISSFLFVRDNGICCFGRDPKVYDKLGVQMQPGLKTSYIAGRPFDVEATFHLEPDIEGPEEGLWWLYRLDGAKVIDK